jgi:hypothetical protein
MWRAGTSLWRGKSGLRYGSNRTVAIRRSPPRCRRPCGIRSRPPAGRQQGRKCSFLKKRTKKLLYVWRNLSIGTWPIVKSFLLLFFKKEVLSFLPTLILARWPGLFRRNGSSQ